MSASGSRSLPAQAARFLLGACIGLAIDFAIYLVLVAIGAPPGLANLVSASCAVIFTYVFSTRYTFGVRGSVWRFVAFCGWYAVSIIGFSLAVEWLHSAFAFAPFWAKAATLPLSFGANFVATRAILVVGGSPSDPDPGDTQTLVAAEHDE